MNMSSEKISHISRNPEGPAYTEESKDAQNFVHAGKSP